MSYQVFARKYRPQTFDAVVGQEHITQTLKNAIATNRLAHAYLFVGPRGTGKTSTARILAKALNCIHGPTVTPCGECDVCREIAAGNSLDVMEIDGASNNGVEQVRELRENVRFAPTRGKYKLYIIDEVHMLSTQAFNALLKTLEEPPEHVKFIFATTDVQKVLPTILSRCQRFDLRRIPGELISRHLEYIAVQEQIQLEAAAAITIARGAEGGLRDAESMLDQLVAFCGQTITEADVLSVFGFTAAQTVSALCDHLLDGHSPSALSIVHQQAEAGRDLSRLMADLIGHLRNLLVAKADPNAMSAIQAEVGKSELEALKNQAGRIAMDRLLDLIEQFAAAEGRMKWAPNKKLHFEIAVIKAIQTLSQATLTEVLDTLSALRTGGELPVRPGPPAPSLTSSPREQSAMPKLKAVSAPESQPAPIVNVAAQAKMNALESNPATIEPESAERGQVSTYDSPSAPVIHVAADEKPVATQAHTSPVGQERTPAATPEKESETPRVVECAEPPALQPVAVPCENGQTAPSLTDSLFAADPAFALLPPAAITTAETPPWEEEPQPEVAVQDETVPAKPIGTDVWASLVAEVRQKKPLLRVWVESGTLLGIEDGVCLVGFPEDKAFAIDSLSKANTRRFLEEMLRSITGKSLSLKLESRAGLAPPPAYETNLPPPPDPIEEFRNDPIIQRALDLFKAEIEL